MLNHKEIKKKPQIITKNKTFIDKYNWKRINYQSEKGDWEKFENNYSTIALNILYAKKGKYILLMFENITQIFKNNFFILMTPDEEG